MPEPLFTLDRPARAALFLSGTGTNAEVLLQSRLPHLEIVVLVAAERHTLHDLSGGRKSPDLFQRGRSLRRRCAALWLEIRQIPHTFTILFQVWMLYYMRRRLAAAQGGTVWILSYISG